jgi:hypothetical protein
MRASRLLQQIRLWLYFVVLGCLSIVWTAPVAGGVRAALFGVVAVVMLLPFLERCENCGG